MKFKPQFITMLVGLAVLFGAAGLAVAAPFQATAPAATTAAPVIRLSALRAAVAPEAVSLTAEISGNFTYRTVPGGEGLVFVDLPGALSALPSQSRILDSPLISSYRVVSYSRDGVHYVRIEVLLKKPVTVSSEKTAGALRVKFVPGGVRTAVAVEPPAPAVPPPAVMPSTAAPAPALRARGNAVEKVAVAREDGVARVRILTNGPVEYRAFQLASPARLVVDIPATESRAGLREIAIEMPPLKSVRVAQFSKSPLVSRVVIDLDQPVRYQVRPQAGMIEVEVPLPGATAAPATAKGRPSVAEAVPDRAPEIVVPASVANVINSLPAPDAMPRLEAAAVKTLEPPAQEPPAQQAPVPEAPAQQPVPPPPAEPSAPPLAPLNVAAAATPAPQEQSTPEPAAPATPAPATPAPATPAPATPAPAARPPASFAPPLPQQPQAPAPPQPAAQAPAAPVAPRYTGEPISLNLKDVDLKDFFRLIHEISGLNIVLDPVVSGRVTIVLQDVPWDQALDIVLRNAGLDKQLEGNVLRIARRDTLRKEEEERLALETAKQAASERVTALRPLNYARAGELVTTLTKFRSPRGEIIADDRTNTLIITDIPQVIPTIDDIIRQLDRRSLQVEIEARVVAASRSFSREVGAQFGFGTTAAGRRTLFFGNAVGSTTENASPVRITGLPEPFSPESGRLPLFSNFPAAGPTSGFSIVHRSPNAAIDFFISLAENRGIGKLLSRPRIITQNNVQGEVQQGIRIPIQTTINNTISVQFINATLRLSVRPQVTNEGSIFLDVSVENSAIDPGTPRINGVPALSTQMATTKVLVNDGSTVVFGGVLQNQNNLTVIQVPLLGSIPVIGNLFKRTGVSTLTNELLFFITPKIV